MRWRETLRLRTLELPQLLAQKSGERKLSQLLRHLRLNLYHLLVLLQRLSLRVLSSKEWTWTTRMKVPQKSETSALVVARGCATRKELATETCRPMMSMTSKTSWIKLVMVLMPMTLWFLLNSMQHSWLRNLKLLYSASLTSTCSMIVAKTRFGLVRARSRVSERSSVASHTLTTTKVLLARTKLLTTTHFLRIKLPTFPKPKACTTIWLSCATSTLPDNERTIRKLSWNKFRTFLE